MLRMRQFVILAGCVSLAPAMAAGQHRAGMLRAAPMRVAPRVVAASPQATVIRMPAVGHGTVMTVPLRTPAAGNITITINNNNGTPVVTPTFSPDFVPVPGLGFDIPHLAATRGAAAVGAVPFAQTAVAGGFPIFEGGFLMPSSPVIVVQVPPIVVQQPVITEAAEPETSARAPEPAAAPVAKQEAAPTPEPSAAEYVFVRRDGSVFFATAYSWEKNTLRYITAEGLRRSIARDALDLAATQEFNEQRGLTIQIPA
jgi:hypothetical protein